ncbi:AbrB family transcriptional regulator [Geminicoccus roseus]|uniref:AbrB family transcriptional regulator n=1 Tax=Geminicoccus roseus TaxID=404900 RepID=UPI00040EB6B5|nr:AbrB family transcriptional regulator [Geminicoccus roseus]
MSPAAPGRLARLPAAAQWSLLLILSALVAALLEGGGLPAAMLLGPMLAGILFGVNGASVQVPKLPYLAAQGVIGCLIAAAISGEILGTFAARWPLILSVVLLVVAASSLLGWVLSRRQILPGTTAVWGSSPGAASAMMLMADAYGADARLVAFMQYLRVVFVAVSASLVARLWVDVADAPLPAIVWFPPIDPLPFGQTLLLAVGGALLGQKLRIPAGALLLPMLAGAALHLAGLMEFQLPEWLLAGSYALLGWWIGLGFRRPILLHAARALPQVTLSILTLMAFAGVLAFALTELAGIDPLTAYLATSPGGLDAMAVIAASSDVDLPFVMALQTVRFVFVLLTGPVLAKFIADRLQPATPDLR